MNTQNWNTFLEALGYELYSSPDAYLQALPELKDIKQYGNMYRSSYKLNGEHRPQRKDKTIILAVRPLQVLEHGDKAQNLISYIAKRDHKDWIDVVRYLAGLVNMELPQQDPEQLQRWRDKAAQQELLETAQEYFIWCLKNAQPAAQLEYLRGRFTDEEIDAMGLGYIPSKQQLQEYMNGRGYTQKDTAALLDSLNGKIGSTHTITIPIRQAGSIDRFIFRHHNQPEAAELAKYQYQTRKGSTEQQNTRFDYIPTRVDGGLAIVEGQLDCLHLLAAGIRNVVATGSNSVNKDAVKDAVRRGAKSFTLLYDADPTDQDPDKNHKHRSRAVAAILEALGEIDSENKRIYVADIPQPDSTKKVDPDSYIKANGKGAVQVLLNNAEAYYKYQINAAIDRTNREKWTSKTLDAFKDEALDIYDTITDAVSRREFENYLVESLDGLDSGTMEQWLADHAAKKRKDKAQKEYKNLLQRASNLAADGNILEAQKLQDRAAAVIGELDAERHYNELIQPTTKASIIEGLKQQPDALHTGLYLGSEKDENEIQLPAGAMSIIAAPTSHGKTTMLVSLAVNAAKQNPSKKYLLLSYEEALEAITIKALSSYAGLEYSASNISTIKSYLTTGKWYGYRDCPELLEKYQQNETDFFTMLEQGRLLIKYTDMYCEALCNSIRRLAAAEPLGAVFIDYVQYLELANSQRNYRRDEEISKICRLLKDVAVDTGLPIILGGQFNRNVTDPTKLALANIGEGGDIERKAAYCLGFWNNDMPYMAGKTETDKAAIAKISKGNVYDVDKPQKNRSITAMVLKNRSGLGAKAGTSGLLSFNGNIGTIATRESQREQYNGGLQMD